MTSSIDILMITFNRPSYTRISIERLLDTCDENMRVWVWHNGNDKETLDVVKEYSSHPRFHRFHHSENNEKLTVPTNWFWTESQGDYLTKVDDDCLMPYGWADTLRAAHEKNPKFGVIGCWRFPEEDFVPELANKKIREFEGGHTLMRNCWVEGSGYLMKRECFERLGPLRPGQSFPNYCIQLAKLGYINGWYHPFLYQNHFDDPRSEFSQLKSDDDMAIWAPLSALKNGVNTVEEWQNQLRRSARLLQGATFDYRYYTGWRGALSRLNSRLGKILGRRAEW